MTPPVIQLAIKPKSLVDSDIVIGKDILELLANAMYVDPLTIYREYVQNAADSIDEARESGLAVDDPNIEILMDHKERIVRIRDNGGSIPNSEFKKRIAAIGASHKRGTDLRGFRGVGRLSGLGYCHELIFRGKAEGDTKIIEVRWNGRALRERMKDTAYAGSLIDVVREIVSVKEIPGVAREQRFFEVELVKVTRLNNDLLMNEQFIRSYLAQVAPVPFHPEFKFGDKIQKFLRDKGVRPPIRIELNDNAGPIYHRARASIEFNPKLTDSLQDVELIEILGDDGESVAFGWVGDHAYMGAIPKKLGLGGIRLRAGNIQVGDESLLAHLYPEQRFASWAIGDIHVFSKKIIPNGRRDDFEHTAQYLKLLSEIQRRASDMAHLIRTRSQQRQRQRNAQILFQAIDSWCNLAKERETPLLLKKALHSLAAEQLQVASKEVNKLDEESESYQSATCSLGDYTKHIENLGKKLEGEEYPANNKLSGPTERAMLKALKVVLSNARSAKVGAKTALDIVAAVSASH
jgi:molecular chaperone HtpG